LEYQKIEGINKPDVGDKAVGLNLLLHCVIWKNYPISLSTCNHLGVFKIISFDIASIHNLTMSRILEIVFSLSTQKKMK